MGFLNWALSQFVIQTVLHSVIIAVVVEVMINLWHIHKPSLRIKFRFLVLLPVIYLPFYFLLYTSRSGVHFHEQVALLDSSEWMKLRLAGDITVWYVFMAILVLTTSFFLVKEVIPSIRYFCTARSSLPAVEAGQFPKLDKVLARLAGREYFRMPEVLLSAEAVPSVYKFVHPALVLSAHTIDMLDDEELEAVIAHELSHLTGQNYRVMQMSLILRFLMFYNPIALFIFRRILDSGEETSDDMAVLVTGGQLALASAILKVYQLTDSPLPAQSKGFGWRRFVPRISTLENKFYRDLIKERVERLLHPAETSDLPYANLHVLFVAVLLLALLFFVV
ncbi:M56 family metallopeptidase [Chloroflexota bacterium]